MHADVTNCYVTIEAFQEMTIEYDTNVDNSIVIQSGPIKTEKS